MRYNDQVRYWNKVANQKEFTTALDLDTLTQFISKEALILDYGCGYGRTLDELYQNGYTNLLGVDFAVDMIARGKAQYPYLNIKTCEDNKMVAKSETFDLVILFAVLTCIISDARQKELICSLERLLKPEGLIYINDFLLNSDERNVSRYACFSDKYNQYGVFELNDGACLRHHSEDHMYDLMDGFEALFFDKKQCLTMNGHVSNAFSMICRKN